MGQTLPKVLILYTGGTFGMDVPDCLGTLSMPVLSPEGLKQRFLGRVPELQQIAQCDVEIVLNLDSAHIGPPEWLLFARRIQKKWKKYDGIVLLHGTDTLTYTASAPSFLLRPCMIPVVITGAQRPLSALRTDARTNLISAVEIAAHGPRGLVKQVTVFFGDKLFQGNRVRKTSAYDFGAFESPQFPPLAVVGTTIRYGESKWAQRFRMPRLKPSFLDGRVLLIHVTPGFPANPVSEHLLPHLDALILVIFHSWTAPTHDAAFMRFLQLTRNLKIPVIIVTQDSSQQPRPETPQINYAAGEALVEEGCFSAGTLTPECAYVKTLLILSQGGGLNQFATLWKQDFAGEGVSTNPHTTR